MPARMAQFEHGLLRTVQLFCLGVGAWRILPNHHHLIVQTRNLEPVVAAIGTFHVDDLTVSEANL